MLIDSHCHLDYLERDGGDVGEIIAEAAEAGVAKIITIGTKWSERAKQIELARRFPTQVFGTIGVHPHEAASDVAPNLKALLGELETHSGLIVGIGETGLDYHYNHSPSAEQRASFRLHCEAAQASGLPLVIHCREAERDLIDDLSTAHGKKPVRGVIHCFSGSQYLADAALEMGFYISVSGIVTFKKADELRTILKTVPLDRLLVETDSPYLAPIPFRGKSNRPAYVVHTAKALAELKAIEFSELATITTANTRQLFGV